MELFGRDRHLAGLPLIDPLEFLTGSLKSLKKMNAVDAQIVLRDLYETRYDIFNHLNPKVSVKRPLASVEFHPSEERTRDSVLEERIFSYVHNNIKEYFGLSLLEFMSLPMEVNQLLFYVAGEEMRIKSTIMGTVESQLSEIGKK